ncbi:Methylmalonyl-CoA epimerase [Geodia barretti]|uniref:Methylmalonyl-CoA epimerase n=1 Tax=Geodia barretti TaxID=519541 RepID=A0AA35RJA8_GEOBA|nr:Methylmalonyl-CoA epimerase [Geodia barretti]
MFTSIHHIHYVVRNRDEMVEYIRNTFGMEPDDLHVVEGRGMKDALYRVGETLIEITEPLDADSGIGQHLADHGPGVYHVAFGVENVRQVAADLAAKGNRLRGRGRRHAKPTRLHHRQHRTRRQPGVVVPIS